MAGTTTYYGISYPTSTDYVKDGATAMQTIADGFDSAVAIPTYNNQTGTTYTFVLADAGKTVTSNNASAVTFTIPPQASVAWANNTTLTVRNLGAGVVTIAGGSGVTVTNTAQTVAQYGEVKLIRTASNAWTVVPASGGASGLSLITSQSFTTASAVNVNNCFSSTYSNYRIICNITACSINDVNLNVRMRASGTDNSSTNYQRNLIRSLNGTVSGGFDTLTEGLIGGLNTTVGLTFVSDFLNPFASAQTKILNTFMGGGVSTTAFYAGNTMIYHNVSSSFDGFSLIPTSGTITGVVKVYGYQD